MADNDDEIELDPSDASERRTLIKVLCINLLQVAVAGGVGIMADSSGLLGAALDNLSDAAVYLVSIYAVGRTVVEKSRVARISGVLLIALGILLLMEVIRRFMGESDPIGLALILTAIFNAGTNVFCLRLLNKQRGTGVHLEASRVFTNNDMYANAGIALSGVLVMIFKSPLPDLIIGLVIVGIAVKGGWEILRKAGQATRTANKQLV